MTAPNATTTSSGLAQNVAGALAYVLGPITGIVFLLIEKENRFVRFHAAQSIAVGIALVVLDIALSIVGTALAAIPFVGWAIALLVSLGLGILSFALWIMLMWRAYQGRVWEVPVVGRYARQFAGLSPES